MINTETFQCKTEFQESESMTREEKSWILYDVANSAFILTIATAVMPIFFKNVAARGVDSAVSTANWGLANAFASLLLALLAPFLGTLADYQGWKKRFFLGFLLLGVIFTLMLTVPGEGDQALCLFLYVAAYIGYAGANIFYDAFLVDVTNDRKMDWISANGFAWGYIGSTVPFILGMILIQRPAFAGFDSPLQATRAAFVITALWWLIFSLPMIRNVHQRHYIPASAHPLRRSLRRLAATFREIRRYRPAFLFLAAYFFYIDGVDTIIRMATAYGVDIGMTTTQLLTIILVIQILAFPFALLYGKLADRVGTKPMLYAGMGVYGIIVLIAYALPSMPTAQIRTLFYWILAVLVASSQGGIQALSRSFFGRLIPKEKSAEFFGFYNIFGKFATILGPLLMALASRITGQSRYGILSLVVLFLIGGLLLSRVPISVGTREE
ncbi:MFS superfamily transporter [Syntrophus aciditrophicus SB]|uniref:MFS superfamily transporter n=2 Tax=Syntrophus TaxID=43773 RepID=Q2LQI7_SYNAS|nr:MFS superfamily transporter [Syntrophus aciditrophicus SB]